MQSLRNPLAAILALLVVACIGCSRGSVPRMIGSTAPDFTIQDSDRTVSLHDLKGKVIVLNFWASWCKPCVDEMPSLVALQQLEGPKVAILAVSTDKSEKDYHQFLQDYRVNLLTVRDPAEKSSHLYGTTGQPETFIIDPSGKIRRKFSGPVNWASPEILEYLSKLQS